MGTAAYLTSFDGHDLRVAKRRGCSDVVITTGYELYMYLAVKCDQRWLFRMLGCPLLPRYIKGQVRPWCDYLQQRAINCLSCLLEICLSANLSSRVESPSWIHDMEVLVERATSGMQVPRTLAKRPLLCM